MAALSANQFEFELADFADTLVPELFSQFKRKIALQGLTGVVLKSPVDTGRFRGNWNVSVEKVDFSTDLEKKDKSGQATINAGEEVIGQSKPYDVIYISNNLPYANRLENGWSDQAPNGMLALTVAEIETQFVDL